MTNEGWPVAQLQAHYKPSGYADKKTIRTYPKLTRRPSAKRMMWRPDGMV